MTKTLDLLRLPVANGYLQKYFKFYPYDCFDFIRLLLFFCIDSAKCDGCKNGDIVDLPAEAVFVYGFEAYLVILPHPVGFLL